MNRCGSKRWLRAVTGATDGAKLRMKERPGHENGELESLVVARRSTQGAEKNFSAPCSGAEVWQALHARSRHESFLRNRVERTPSVSGPWTGSAHPLWFGAGLGMRRRSNRPGRWS